MGAAIVAMEAAAIGLALLVFGWPAMLVGAPLLLTTAVGLAVVQLTREPRRRWRERRDAEWAAEWDGIDAPVQPGLMSGFFEVTPARVPPTTG